MSDELKPCQKCGGAQKLYTSYVGAMIRCDKCRLTTQYDTVLEAVAAHLARPVEDALRAENAALKAQWANVPWDDIADLASVDEYAAAEFGADPLPVRAWINANAPKEEPHP